MIQNKRTYNSKEINSMNYIRSEYKIINQKLND